MQKKEKLIELQFELKNLFQLNNKDLDFGIYKIYGVLNDKLNNWIDNKLPQKVEKELNNIQKENFGEIEKQLEEKIEEINEKIKSKNEDEGSEIGLLDKKLSNLGELLEIFKKGKFNEILKDIEKLNKELKKAEENINLDTTVYNYILEFYNSIYSDGDYILPRKRVIGNDVNEQDVCFDWKTKGQILIKNMDIQTYFSFETKNNKQVEFKIVDIIDYGDNSKNKTRFLIPVDFKLEENNLIVEFILGKFDETTFNHILDKQSNISIKNKIENLVKIIDNEDLYFGENNKKYTLKYKDFSFGEKQEAILLKIKGDKTDKFGVLHLIKLFLDKKNEIILKQDLFNFEESGVLNNKNKLLDFKDEKENNCFLAKNLRKWYRMGTSDFFLNPNLAKELEEYKNEFIKNKMFHYLLEGTKGDTNKANVLKAFEKIVNEINSFVATIEEIQVQLFNRKKYIYETHYVITFDRLKIFSFKEDLVDLKEFLKNFIGEKFNDLQKEYIELGIIKEEDKKNNLGDFIDYILENDKLYLDTKIFINKTGKQFFEVYSKTFDLLEYISRFIDYVNKNKAEDKVIEEKLKELNIRLEQGEKLNLDKLLNGELYKGDNYHALNLLQNKYSESIKTIYIDPPYNTGNDGFLYKDNMKHATWLTMMESRLKLARELMKEEGVIFSSIDDNEVDNLKRLENIIFGDENFVGNFIWFKKLTGGYDNKILNTQHEYLTFFSKNIENINITLDITESKYKLIDEKGKKYKWDSLWNVGGLTYSKSLDYAIIAPDGTEIFPIGEKGKAFWLWSKDKVEREKKELFFKKDKNGKWKVYKKVYASNGIIPGSMLKKEIVGGNTNATAEIKLLFGGKPFDTIKPTTLIKKIIYNGSNKNDVILDFFPGSGTTADAVIRLNQEDKGNRKFILTEINDYFDEIIIPRIKKVSYSLEWKNGKAEDNKGPGIFFSYSYLENYEDTLENFVLKLEKTLHDEELQKNNLGNDLYNLALAIGIAFEKDKINTSFKNFQLKDEKTYPSYKLETKRDDIHNFIEEKFEKKSLKAFVDLVHYYPLSKEGKWSLKSVRKENQEFVFEYENSENQEIEIKKLEEIDVD